MINLNSTTSSASARNGIAGLASGLDTESIVKAMTAGVTNKINAQYQLKTTLSWKTEAYRSIINQLSGFGSKYADYASKTNALSPTFFTGAAVTAKGDNAAAVSVSGVSTTSDKLSITNITSYAKTAGFVSGKSVTDAAITTGSIDFSEAGRVINNLAGETINVSYGGKSYDVKIASDFAGADAASAAAAFNAALGEIDIGDGKTLADAVGMTAGGDGKIAINLKDSGDTETFKIDGGSGKSLAALGIKAGDAATSAEGITAENAVADNITSNLTVDGLAKSTFSLEYNGVSKSFVMPEITGDTEEERKASFLAGIQEQLNTAFGNNKVRASLDDQNRLSFETIKADGTTDANSTLRLSKADASLTGDKGLFGISVGASNRLDLGANIQDANLADVLTGGTDGIFKFTVNDVTFEVDTANESIQSLMERINNSDAGVSIQYLSTTNRFSVTAKESGAQGRVDISDVEGGGNLASALFGTQGTGAGQYSVTNGADAEIEISYDGGKTTSVLTRSTNTFDIDGLSVKLNADVTFEAGKAITFDKKSNTDDVLNGIKDIVDAYNSILESVYKEVNTRPIKGYTPLLDEQKKEMSENEIKLWEESAKTGLLYGDTALNGLARDMRFITLENVAGVGNLSEIGITTSSSWSDNGKLVIDEEKLRAAIEKDPNFVSDLFTKTVGKDEPESGAGIMQRMKSLVSKYANNLGTNKGILVNIAGLPNSLSAMQNSLYKQTKSVDDTISNLQRTLKAQEDRYYKQFASLETYISNMNAQSSWITSQFG